MSLGTRLGPRKNLSPRDNAAWLAALVILAIAMPVDNAIGSNPFFLRTHGISGWGFALLQVVITAVGWLIAWGVLALVRKAAPERAFDITTSVITFIVATVAAANALAAEPHVSQALASIPAWGWWILGLLVGAAITLLARRFAAGLVLMIFLTIASLVPIITAALNSASSDVSASITWEDKQDRPSVLWIIVDELNDHAVVNSDGQVHDYLPNIAEFQQQATTYTHAYGLSNKTERAIPAMMAGLSNIGEQDDATMNALSESMGITGDLGEKYSVTLSSSIFAPPSGVSPCNDDGSSAADKASTLAADVAAVAGNTALMPAWRGPFPAIQSKWRDYWVDTSPGWVTVATGRLSCQVESGDPFLAVWHTLSTHNPYVYGRDGQPIVLEPQRTLAVIDPGMNIKGEVTTPELYEFQRRLYANSVRNADRRIGQVLGLLKASGRYDDTMVIITADHGVAITEARRDGSGGEDERRVGADTEQMWGEIAQVPLLVKYPGQSEPTVVDAPRTSSQIMPTILQEMGATAKLPWPMQPPLDQDPSAITFTLKHLGAWTPFDYPGPGRWDEWSPTQTEPDLSYQFAIGIDPALLGKPVPAGLTQVPVRTTIPPTMSSQTIIQFHTAQRCPADASLLTVQQGGHDVVVGSVLWEASSGSSTRGWAIIPTRLDTDVKVWCAP